MPYFGVIDNPVRWAVIAGIALFPVTIAIAWFFEHPWHNYTGRRIFVDVMVIGIVAVAAGTWVWRNLPEDILSRTSIVVLPFSIQEGDSVGQTVSRALAYEVISLLMKSRSIDVIGYESATSPALSGLNKSQLSSRLNVEHLLTGTVYVNGDQMQISATLEDTAGNVLWRGDLDENLDDLFQAEEKLAAGVKATLGAGDETVSIETLAAKRCEMPTESDVLERYYTARHFLELRGEGHLDELRESIAIFEALIEERPDFAEAMSGLSWAYWVQPTYDRETSYDENMPKAKKLAANAYKICDQLGEAMILIPNEHDHENGLIGATQQFEAAIAMQPDKTEIQNKYARHLGEVGRVSDGRHMARKTYETNPLSIRSIKNYAGALQYTEIPEKMDEAASLYDLARELGSNVPNFAIGHKKQIACRRDIDCMISNDLLWDPLLPYVDTLRIAFREPENEEMAAESLAAARSVLKELPFTVNFFNATACWYDHLTPVFFDAWEAVEHESQWFAPNVWLPNCGNVWQSDEFKIWADEQGLVEYWQTIAWPDYCQPDGDSFVCKDPD